MSEFDIDGVVFQAGMLPPMRQLHVAKRIGKVAGPLLVAWQSGLPLDDMTAWAVPIAQAIGELSDADTDFVVHECLSVCKRQTGPAWGPVLAPGTTRLMDETMDLATILRLVAEVIKLNIGPFTQKLRSKSSDAAGVGEA